VVGGIAFDLVGVRVDREDLVAALAQPLVDGVAAVVSGVRETPVTATRLWPRKSDAASLIVVIESPFRRDSES
jgi:hypothetical protein